ncbi:MAG: TA system VapC family ribonuclease toxin [Verrucomicrobiales bacterium]
MWIASYFKGHPHHAIAAEFMRGRSVDEPASLSRAVELSWLRLVTTASVCRGNGAAVLTNPAAIEALDLWRSRPQIRRLDAEPEGTRELWLELAGIPSASPKVWMDGYLAAFAIRAGLPFATLDIDFRRFEAAGLQLHLVTA